MDFRTDESCTLKINLGFNSHDVIDTKENSIHLNHEIERQKALERELTCAFIRINPDEKDFNIFKEINKIHRHIKKSTKKSLIDDISKRLLKLEFKQHNAIKSKCLKWIFENTLPNYKK